MTIRLLKYIALLALIMSAGSCTQQDISECPAYATVTYYYTLNSSSTNTIENEIDSLSILIYNAEGLYQRTEKINEIAVEAKIPLSLPSGGAYLYSVAGDYSAHKIYDSSTGGGLIAGVSTLDDTKVEIVTSELNVPQTNATELFIGQSVYLPTTTLGVVHCDIGLVDHHKNIVVKLISATDQQVNLAIKNGTISHSLEQDTTMSHIIYTTDTQYIDDTLVHEHTTMRLHFEDSTALINLSPLTRSTDSSVSLMEAITQSPDYQSQEDLDSENDYEIVLKDTLDMLVLVSINDWEVVSVTPN
ncbi:MAG: FimB/Mfa2 family fimbrial subunit [Rikenellaceae bacterium]